MRIYKRNMGPYTLTLEAKQGIYTAAVTGPGLHLTAEVNANALAAAALAQAQARGLLAGGIFDDVASFVKKTAKSVAKSKALRTVLSAAAAVTSHPAVSATLQATLGPAGATIPAALGAADAAVRGDPKGAAMAAVMAATANLGPMGGPVAAAAGPIVDQLFAARKGQPKAVQQVKVAVQRAKEGHPQAKAVVIAWTAASRAIRAVKAQVDGDAPATAPQGAPQGPVLPPQFGWGPYPHGAPQGQRKRGPRRSYGDPIILPPLNVRTLHT